MQDKLTSWSSFPSQVAWSHLKANGLVFKKTSLLSWKRSAFHDSSLFSFRQSGLLGSDLVILKTILLARKRACFQKTELAFKTMQWFFKSDYVIELSRMFSKKQACSLEKKLHLSKSIDSLLTWFHVLLRNDLLELQQDILAYSPSNLNSRIHSHHLLVQWTKRYVFLLMAQCPPNAICPN
jgi:hypothetical protein